MGNRKFKSPLKDNLSLFLVFIAALLIVVSYYNYRVGIVSFVVFVILIVVNFINNWQKNKRWESYIGELSGNIDSAARYAILNLPLPLVLLDFDGKVSWYNSKFLELMDEKGLIDESIESLIPTLDFETMLENQGEYEVRFNDQYFTVLNNIVRIDNNQESAKYVMMLYFIDNTDYVQIKTQYFDQRMTVALISVDNYDDVMSETKEEKIPFVTSEIEKRINLWASRMSGMIKKYQKDRYIVIFEERFLKNLIAKKFTILDDIREIDEGNKTPVTLSIGVGVGDRNPSSLEEDAYQALELALGRGGDQAVIRQDEAFSFYGGKTKAVEKRNRVKARVIAHGFRSLVEEADKVLIMGHRSPDMDCYGAAIGVYRAVLNRGKNCYIVLNQVTGGIADIHAKFEDNPDYRFITTEMAEELLTDHTLLCVVDTNRPSITEAPSLIEKTENVFVIDHHRMGAEFIENTVLRYLEPYASSTCELVTEILQYTGTKVILDKNEAEALLAGITVDTKSFTFKTGVRTFDAAAFLRRNGADTTEVKQFFQDDLTTFSNKAKIISNAQVYAQEIAISVVDEPLENGQIICAQGADELLNIKGISTSFVIGIKEDDTIFISGRSLGTVSVQLILEKIGGGGHLEVAGAQFYDTTIPDVKRLLQEAIDSYLFEEE